MDTFTAVSNRQKGFLSPVEHVFPRAGHRFCLRHIMNKITKTTVMLTNDDRRLICEMACSDCENDYKLYHAELLQTKAGAVAYLDKLDQRHWVKFQYQEVLNMPTYGEITSNLSEQANNWMGNEMRSSKPLDAFHMYFLKLGQLLSGKRQIAAN